MQMIYTYGSTGADISAAHSGALYVYLAHERVGDGMCCSLSFPRARHRAPRTVPCLMSGCAGEERGIDGTRAEQGFMRVREDLLHLGRNEQKGGRDGEEEKGR